jgi:alcohol dehydrogenase class IV
MIYPHIAIAMGKNVDGMNKYEAAQQAVNAVKELNDNSGIPSRLRDIGVPEDYDLEVLAKNADDQGITVFCPRKASIRDLVGILKAAM